MRSTGNRKTRRGISFKEPGENGGLRHPLLVLDSDAEGNHYELATKRAKRPVNRSVPASVADKLQDFSPVLLILERISCGGIILSSTGEVVTSNAVADAILAKEPQATGGDVKEQLSALLRLSKKRFQVERDAWVLLERSTQRPLVVHSQPLGRAVDPNEHSLLILIDLAISPMPDAKVLKRVFDLTASEALVARAVVHGQTPEEIAKQRGSSMKTVRNHLASIFQKTRTSRQPELVAVLARMAILP